MVFALPIIDIASLICRCRIIAVNEPLIIDCWGTLTVNNERFSFYGNFAPALVGVHFNPITKVGTLAIKCCNLLCLDPLLCVGNWDITKRIFFYELGLQAVISTVLIYI